MYHHRFTEQFQTIFVKEYYLILYVRLHVLPSTNWGEGKQNDHRIDTISPYGKFYNTSENNNNSDIKSLKLTTFSLKLSTS